MDIRLIDILKNQSGPVYNLTPFAEIVVNVVEIISMHLQGTEITIEFNNGDSLKLNFTNKEKASDLLSFYQMAKQRYFDNAKEQFEIDSHFKKTFTEFSKHIESKLESITEYNKQISSSVKENLNEAINTNIYNSELAIEQLCTNTEKHLNKETTNYLSNIPEHLNNTVQELSQQLDVLNTIIKKINTSPFEDI